MNQPGISLGDVATVIFTIMGIAIVLALILIAWVFIRVRRLNIPAAADFFETLRHTPISVVIMLDMLDLGLDFLSAPISWVILDRLNLKQLRWISTIEALIPGTEFLPTMTAAWLIARAVPNLRVGDQAPEFLKLLAGRRQTRRTY